MIISYIGMMKKQTQTFNLQCFYFLFYILSCLLEFLRLGNSAWEFFGVLIFGQGIFWGFDFCHNSIIPVT